MSKTNADFSAFDFNDSSENSLNSRSIFLNRGGLSSVTNSVGNGASEVGDGTNVGGSGDGLTGSDGSGGVGLNGACSSSQATSEIGVGDTNLNGNNEGSNALDAVSVAINAVNNAVGSGAAIGNDVLVNNFSDIRSGSASLSNNSAATTGGLGGGGSSVEGGSASGGSSAGSGSGGGSNTGSGSKKYRHQNFSKNIYIGTKNAEKWEVTRTRLAFKNDVEFVAYLLNLADNDTERSSSFSSITSTTKSLPSFPIEPSLNSKSFNPSQPSTADDPLPLTKSSTKAKKRVQFNDSLNGFTAKSKGFPNFSMKVPKHEAQDKAISSSLDNDTLPEVLDCRIAEKIKSELAEKSASIHNDSFKGALCLKKPSAESFQMFNPSDAEDDDYEDENDNDNDEVGGDIQHKVNSPDKGFRIRDRSKSKKSRKANGKLKQQRQKPELKQEPRGDEDDDYDEEDDDGDDVEEGLLATEIKDEQNFIEEEDEHDHETNYGLRSCRDCTVTHDYEQCALRNAMCFIKDAIDLSSWIEKKNIETLEKLKSNMDKTEERCDDNTHEDDSSSQASEEEVRLPLSFAEASIPKEFELRNIDATTFGVFAKIDIPPFTKLGPIIGKPVQVNDIPDDSNMKTIFEICEGDQKSNLISCDDPNSSNWLRYIRPAVSYEERTVNLVSIERQAFMVTSRELKAGFELLYWSDDCNTMWRKKHTEKTNCGGCNLKFEHPLFYRTHCSVFHDPSFSLTIRKYHCKVCGEAVLGKDNIMKHAAEMHEGKGAYQCQFCSKFFLRLNYLEMHRTYGCSANPQRARPLCDFCGRKFCQPQKLKVHIKRMHSDMAEVLRDFQCKLCSKLLGSRAALQRHSKEVHSRNSAVVSCPRCQKLFQNRSNLKIHMLTHSGVRPFKCAETECTAAFTTKQCLQFHYKKVHNYTQEQMPKIERSVAYTFDAYSGGMKVDFLEQAPRRRRKSLEDQNSILSSSILDSKSDTEFSDDIFESIKKSGKSIKDLCRNETNLSLLSSKINNIFTKSTGKKRKKKQKNQNLNEVGEELDEEDDRVDQARRKQTAQMNLVETFLSKTAQRISEQQQASAAAAAVAAMVDGADGSDKLHMAAGHLENPGDHENSFRHHDHMVNTNQPPTMMQRQNLVVSKGSKKWISDDDRHMVRDCPSSTGISGAFASGSNPPPGLGMSGVPPAAVDDPSKLLPNRDFIARLMGSATSDHQNHPISHEEDENSSFLDVVDSNNPSGVNAGQMNQFHHNGVGAESAHHQSMHMNSIAHPQSFMNTFYNNSNTRLTGGSTGSSSASMLVEAALNSVGSMMDNDGNELKGQVNSNLDNGNQMNSQIDVESDRFRGSNMTNMDNLENEIKLMKNLNSFSMQVPPLPMYPSTGNSMNTCDISPDTSTPTDPQSNQNNNDIDVDAGSTPRGQHIGGGGDSEGFSSHHQTPPSPQTISPGRDYSMFGNNSGPNGTGTGMSSSSPLPSMQQRRNASSVGASAGSGYTEHELISPASSPSIPRYNFSANDLCRKRDDDTDRSHNISGHTQLSSDDENSILPQNSSGGQDMRMKFNQSQMDLVYSKYESMTSAANLKYSNNQDLEVSSDYRNNSNSDLSDLQGLDMTSRSNVGSNYHHNFQLPPTGSNLGLGRYHHHIYDILSEREQQQQQQQQQHHSQQQQQQQEHSSQLTMQQHQSMHNHSLLPDQLNDQDHDQATSVDLSRTANYVVSSPPQLPYNHPHHDVLRMVSLDLTPNGNMGVGNNRSFLPSQIQHNNREGIDHHRLLSTAEQHRLLVDPTAHLLMEQNNRLLGSDQTRLLGESAAQNRHMAARGFGAYHQVASGNYHPSVRPVLPSPNHHASNPSNYHPFPAYY